MRAKEQEEIGGHVGLAWPAAFAARSESSEVMPCVPSASSRAAGSATTRRRAVPPRVHGVEPSSRISWMDHPVYFGADLIGSNRRIPMLPGRCACTRETVGCAPWARPARRCRVHRAWRLWRAPASSRRRAQRSCRGGQRACRARNRTVSEEFGLSCARRGQRSGVIDKPPALLANETDAAERPLVNVRDGRVRVYANVSLVRMGDPPRSPSCAPSFVRGTCGGSQYGGSGDRRTASAAERDKTTLPNPFP
jgi:hypothetical protein